MSSKKRTAPSQGKWNHEQTKALIGLWGQEETQSKLGKMHRKRDIFEEISSGFEKTAEQCKTKVKNLKSRYRTVLDHNNKSGNDPMSMRYARETLGGSQSACIVGGQSDCL